MLKVTGNLMKFVFLKSCPYGPLTADEDLADNLIEVEYWHSHFTTIKSMAYALTNDDHSNRFVVTTSHKLRYGQYPHTRSMNFN